MGSFQATDDRGEYRVYGLPAGEYVVGTSAFFGSTTASRQPSDEEIKDAFDRAERAAIAAAQPNGAAPPPAPTPRVDYAAVYYPAAANIIDAARIRVAAGEERTGIDLTLVLRPMSAISGQVTGLDTGAGQADRAEMLLTDHTKGSTLFTGLDADARFAYRGLAPGDYTIVARTSGPSMKSATATVTLTGTDVTGLTLALGSPPMTKGRVVIDGLDAVPALLSQISVAPTPAQAKDFTSTSSGRVDANGEFSLIGPLPRRVRFRPILPPASSGAPPLTLASVTVNGADVTDLAIDVPPSGDIGAVVVTLSPEFSSLSGTVTKGDGAPASGYFMVAVAADQRYWLWGGRRIQSARTDADGKYTFKDLPPGVYRIAATTDLETTDLSDRSFIEQIVGASAEVAIAPKEKKTFDLKLGGS